MRVDGFFKVAIRPAYENLDESFSPETLPLEYSDRLILPQGPSRSTVRPATARLRRPDEQSPTRPASAHASYRVAQPGYAVNNLKQKRIPLYVLLK
eukprot:1191443-Prorocentrum_minimum.AAC.4